MIATFRLNIRTTAILFTLIFLTLKSYCHADIIDSKTHAERPNKINHIKAVRIWNAPEKTRVVFDISDPIEYKYFVLSSPHRLVLDLVQTKLSTSLNSMSTLDTPIKQFRHATKKKHDLRIVLDLNELPNIETFLLPPNTIYGNRLVIDIFNTTKLTEENQQLPTKKQLSNKKKSSEKAWRDIIIVIDAGHGGEDPGTVTKSGIYEKTITLAIAKELEKLFVKEKGFQVKMTRTGDYYVELRERSNIARKIQADLFISIHANTFDDPVVHGSSVYALSLEGASTETARWMEQRENNTDLIGGERTIKINTKNDVLANLLLDLSMNATLTKSMEIGQHVLRQLGKINTLHKKTVGQAAFLVLKSPDVPSILIEAGFLSNPKGQKKLLTAPHRKNLAKYIFIGVKQWFVKNPPSYTYLKKWKRKS